MLNQFWIHAKVQVYLTIRGYNALFRIAEAQAKLQLRTEVDADIATQTMESFQLMMVQYDQTIQTIKNPRDTTFDAFLGILEDTKGPIEITELCKLACKRNLQVQAYLGTKWSIASNWKLREVVRLLLNHPRVKQISIKPLTVSGYLMYMMYVREIKIMKCRIQLLMKIIWPHIPHIQKRQVIVII